MKLKFIGLFISMLMLVSCVPNPPTVNPYQAILIKQEEQELIWDITENYFKSSDGDLGVLKVFNNKTTPKTFSGDEEIYNLNGSYLRVMEVEVEDAFKSNYKDTTLQQSLTQEISSKLGLKSLTVMSSLESEIVLSFEKEYLEDYSDIEVSGYIGISKINDAKAMVLLGIYPEETKAGIDSDFREIFLSTFEQRVFRGDKQDDTQEPAPAKTHDKSYIEIGTTDFVGIVDGDTYALTNGRETRFWASQGISVVISENTLNQLDLNIFDENLSDIDAVKRLLEDYRNLKNIEIEEVREDIDFGISDLETSVTLKYDTNNYATLIFLGDENKMTTFAIHSKKPLPKDFFIKTLRIIPKDYLKEKGEYIGIAPLSVQELPSDLNQRVPMLNINKEALMDLTRPTKKYITEKFDESRLSGHLLTKQLYAKDRFIDVVFPVTITTEAQKGVTNFVKSSLSGYKSEQIEDAKNISLEYGITTNNRTSTGDTQVSDIYGFYGVAQDVLSDIISEMESNNISYNNELSNITSKTYQHQFDYRYDDTITNLKYNKHVAVYMKNLGKDKYTGEDIVFYAKLVWGGDADDFCLGLYQSAFDTTVKSVNSKYN